MSRLFASGGQSIVASALASVLLVNIQGWSPLGLIDLLAVQGTLQSLSSTTLWKHQFGPSFFFTVQFSHPYMTTGKNHSFDHTDLCGQSDVSLFLIHCLGLSHSFISKVQVLSVPANKFLLGGWLMGRTKTAPNSWTFGGPKEGWQAARWRPIRGKKLPLCLTYQHLVLIQLLWTDLSLMLWNRKKNLPITHPVRKVLLFCHLWQLGNTQMQHYLIKQFRMAFQFLYVPSTKQMTGETLSLNSFCEIVWPSFLPSSLPALFLSLDFSQTFVM